MKGSNQVHLCNKNDCTLNLPAHKYLRSTYVFLLYASLNSEFKEANIMFNIQ